MLHDLGSNSSRKLLILSFVALAAGIPAQADILGDASNFAVLFEGNGGNAFQYNNSTLNDNVGIGATGAFQGNGPGSITGNIEFSGANTGQYSNSGLTITGGLSYGNSNVQTDLNNLNSLSQTWGGEAGTSLTISSGGSVNVNTGNLVNGNYVFTLANGSNFPNGTFTFVGDNSHAVIVNVPMSFSFNGSIALSGGLTSDNLFFNFTGGNYSTLSGGNTLTISTNGAVTTGTFLDPNGAIQMNHSVLDGRLFGGDTHNEAVVSGDTLNAPALTAVPEPSSILLFATLVAICAYAARRRLHRA